MGLKAKVCFTGDMGSGFGVWLGSGFRVYFLLEIDYREEHKEHEHILIKKK